MNWHEATLAQLAVIRYDDPMATLADKAAAENELKRREKRRSGKIDKHAGSKR